jgi:phytoene dehydrogenase-like protein
MIIIIGGGLAGLACAIRLEEAGVDWLLLEASAEAGGRVATDLTQEGYRLDRGFQVLLDSYPTACRLLDLSALKPRYFESGALLVKENGESERFLNPLAHPEWAAGALFSNAFSWKEKLFLSSFAVAQLLRSDGELLSKERGHSTMEEIRCWGIGGGMLEKFLRPFFAGVFLDRDLKTDASIFHYTLKKFALGRALLPSEGMKALPEQLASKLPQNRIRYGAKVVKLHRKEEYYSAVELASSDSPQGEIITCDQIVLATDERTSRQLLGLPPGRRWHGVTTLYFSGDQPLYDGALIALPQWTEGNNRLVCHFSDLTNIAPEYAPPGKRLLSVTILTPPTVEDSMLAAMAQDEITTLFPAFASWKFLQAIHIPCALPARPSGFSKERLPSHFSTNLWLAGDQVTSVSIESALASGLQTAEELLSRV